MDETLFDLVVTQLYQAALAPRKWAACLEDIRRLLHADAGVQLVPSGAPDTGLVVSTNIDAGEGARYAAYFRQVDPYMQGFQQSPRAGVVPGEALLAYADLRRSEYYADFLAPQDLHWHLSAVLDASGPAAGYLTLLRARRAPNFDEREHRLLVRLLPHLRAATEVQRRLAGAQQQQRQLLEAFQHLADGLILADAEENVLYLNPPAEEMLKRSGALRVVKRRLLAATSEDQGRLAAAFQACRFASGADVSPPDAAVSLCDPRRDAPLEVLVRPFVYEWAYGDGPAPAFLLLLRPVAEAPLVRLRRRYRLTRAELLCATRLAQGVSTAELAEQLGISLYTVRAHLRSLYAKTGTHRQPALVALIHRECSADPAAISASE